MFDHNYIFDGFPTDRCPFTWEIRLGTNLLAALIQCLSKKLGFLAIYEVKWGGFT